MKKKFLAICIMLLTVLGSFGGVAAFAEVSLEECDRCFRTTVNALLTEDEVGADSITADRRPIYDLNLQHLGYLYEFDIAVGSGYTIIICDKGEYVAQELVADGESPYAGVEEGLCVYVCNWTYFKSVDGVIYDIATSVEIPQEKIEELKKSAFLYEEGSGTVFEDVSVTVTYTSKTVDKDSVCYLPPSYGDIELSGACAAVAGTNILGFFDRYYEDLIPNHSAGYTYYGYYVYNVADTYVCNVMRELYSDMNGTAAGISESNFKSGMEKYCAKKSRSCNFTDLKSWGKLDYSAVKTCIKDCKPLVMFLNTYNICDVNGYDGYDILNYTKSTGNHVMVGFGYADITYTLSNGANANYQFIKVSTGFSDKKSAFFNINYNTNIVSAYRVNIF